MENIPLAKQKELEAFVNAEAEKERAWQEFSWYLNHPLPSELIGANEERVAINALAVIRDDLASRLRKIES